MTVRPDEDSLAEQPALDLFKRLGYAYIHGDVLDAGCPDRRTQRDVVLAERLRAAIKKLNPWINDANLAWVVHRLSEVQATDTMEANQRVHADLTQHLSREQEVDGKRGFQTIRVIDWDDPVNNDFLVVNQLKIKGADDRRPDAIVFVNGLPLAVIECKAPDRPHPKDEGIKQLRVYQGAIPRLFWSNHFLIVAAGARGAWHASLGSPSEFFFDWRDPWPTSREEIERLVGRAPTPQDLLLVSIFEKARFVDHVRNFVVFEREGNKTIKKLPRYQQFRAVNKTIDRIRSKSDPKERSGIVWHTQGSGKSLTMVWIALKLRRDPRNENPTILVVTDRNDLDRQISTTFKNCGYTVHRARSVRDLHARLKEPGGLTLTTTIQKFLPEKHAQTVEEETGLDTGQERGAPAIPLLTDASNVFVLVDEAHRTQYRSLAANMRTALPNATFLGFTGTPIDKKDRQTHRTFGPYIDTYTIQQSVDDEATVKILYEGRFPELRVEGANNIDELFDRFFARKTDEERAEIKKRYATLEAVACAPDRVHKIALNVAQHFEQFIAPGGFKAQLVAVSREAAVLYKERLDALNGPESAVVISASHKDENPKIKAWHRTKEEQDEIIGRFKDKDDPLKMLIVCDMLPRASTPRSSR
jgi:type I restriction enzyme R subunit